MRIEKTIILICFTTMFFRCTSIDENQAKEQIYGETDSTGKIYKIIEKDFSGNIVRTTNWENSERNGDLICYSNSGKITAKSYYKNDLLQGYYYLYDSNEVLIQKGFCRNGLEFGCSYLFNSKGDTISVQNFFYGEQMVKANLLMYKKGELDKPFLKYLTYDSISFESGKIFSFEIFVANKNNIENPKMYIDKIFEDGKLKQAYYYMDEQKNGMYNFLFEPLHKGTFEFEGYLSGINKANKKQIYIPFYFCRKIK